MPAMTRRVGERRLGGSLAALLAALVAALLLAGCGGRDQAGGAAAAAGQSATQAAPASGHAATDHATADHAGADHPSAADQEGAADHAATDHAAAEPGASSQAPDAHVHDATPASDPHAAHAETLAAGELPGTSLFHLTGEFTAQDGTELTLSELRGHPVVVVMFYGDCTTACPLLVKSAQDIEAALPAEVAAQTQFVMVSFDTARDTPDKLRAYADEKGLDKTRWHWLVGSPLLTRQLATLLGVQYRDAGNGVFAHSNLITVLDPEGVPSARLEGLGVALDPALDAIRAAVD